MRKTLVLIAFVIIAVCGIARADEPCAEPAYFGTWGEALEAPYMSVSVGGNMRFLPRTRSGATVARATTTEPTPAAATTDVGYGYVERVTVAPRRRFYLGVEMELGVSNVDEHDPGQRRVVAAGLGLAGLRLGTSVITLSGELGAGGRVIEVAGSPRFDSGGIVEARGRVDLWLAPWFTVGGTLATNLLDRDEWAVGLSITMHTWAYGHGR